MTEKQQVIDTLNEIFPGRPFGLIHKELFNSTHPNRFSIYLIDDSILMGSSSQSWTDALRNMLHSDLVPPGDRERINSVAGRILADCAGIVPAEKE